ncbi:MAG TPA: Ig-like domain-containing protein, partial [Vicinamibacteria bacterium]
ASITLPALDAEDDALAFEVVGAPAHGTVTLAGDVATYTPATRYVGPDSFTFKARDPSAESNVATVSITVLQTNEPPVAPDVAVTTPEDTPVPVALPATDPDGDALTITYTAPAHGVFDGTTYTPSPGYHGPDAFTYTATDPEDESDTGTVTITVTPVNDAPVAASQALSTAEDTPLPVVLTATDVEGDGLSFAVMAGPQHGTLSGTGPSLTYTPAPDYHGPDSFTFQANDGALDSNVATVAIVVTPVNDAPVAADQAVETAEDTAVAITLGAADADGDPLTYAVVAGPQHGTLSGTGPSLTYTPAADYHGPDSFTFKANDGALDSNVATVTIEVTPVNDAPVAADQAVATDEDTPIGVTLVAADPEGDALVYAVVAGPQHGSLSGAGASLTYTPEADYHGPDSFTFRARDGTLDSNVATVSITVGPVNDGPVAADQDVTTNEDTPVGITLVAADVDGDALAYSVVTSPQHGTLSGTGPSLTYTPAADYHGPDGFTFRARDGALDSNVATVRITVRPVNDAPSCVAAAAVPEQELWPPNHRLVRVNVVGLTDVEGEPITVQVTAIRQDEPVSGQGSGNTAPDAVLAPPQVRVERQGGRDGRVYHLSFTASDASGGTCTRTVAVCVPHDQGDGVPVAHSADDGHETHDPADLTAGGSTGRGQCVDQGPLHDSTQP